MSNLSSKLDQQFHESYKLKRREVYFYYHFCFGTPPKAYQQWELKSTLRNRGHDCPIIYFIRKTYLFQEPG
jgi:hypothetical protein